MKINFFMQFVLGFAALACVAPVQAVGPTQVPEKSARDLVVEENVNDYSQKAVFIDVDHKDHVYVENELLVATIKSDSDGYLYLLHYDTKGNCSVLFPNEWFKDNRIKANETVQYPTPNASYRFRVTGPNFGTEKIVAYVTQEPLKSIDSAQFSKGSAKKLDAATEAKLNKELKSRRASTKDVISEENPENANNSNNSDGVNDPDYAMHYVDIETKSRSSNNSPTPGKQVAICIGIGAYRSYKIGKLDGCVTDAKEMMNIFQKYCGVLKGDCYVLCDKDATLENIREIFVDILPSVTSPGDVVYIYWSGHGQALKGVRSENDSDKSEYLVPYDADLSSISSQQETLLHEDAFGAWIRLLSDRKVLVFLDACYSGGMTNNAKSAGVDSNDSNNKGLAERIDQMLKKNSKSVDSGENWTPFRFGTKAFSRSKALGQSDLYVLASSTAEQTSKMREEGDMSVMTYCLTDIVKNGSSSLTHKDLYLKVKKAVDDYMKVAYPYALQSVVVQDDLNPALPLKK